MRRASEPGLAARPCSHRRGERQARITISFFPRQGPSSHVRCSTMGIATSSRGVVPRVLGVITRTAHSTIENAFSPTTGSAQGDRERGGGSLRRRGVLAQDQVVRPIAVTSRFARAGRKAVASIANGVGRPVVRSTTTSDGTSPRSREDRSERAKRTTVRRVLDEPEVEALPDLSDIKRVFGDAL